MTRARLNLLLLVFAVALGAGLYLDREQPEKHPSLTALDEQTLARIRIEHPGHPAIELNKQGAAWQLVSPVQAPADPFELASLLGVASAEAQRSLPLADVDLKELKLDPPQFTLKLDDQRLDFGDVEPIQFRRYVRYGDQVALIPDPSASALDADFSDLVAKDLLPAGAQLQRIAVPDLVVERAEDGHWHSAQHSDADPATLQAFVDHWQQARAMWNAALEDGDDQLGEPITLTLADGTQIALRLITKEPQLVLARPDRQVRYTLSKEAVTTLLALPAAAATTPGTTPGAPSTAQQGAGASPAGSP